MTTLNVTQPPRFKVTLQIDNNLSVVEATNDEAFAEAAFDGVKYGLAIKDQDGRARLLKLIEPANEWQVMRSYTRDYNGMDF